MGLFLQINKKSLLKCRTLIVYQSNLHNHRTFNKNRTAVDKILCRIKDSYFKLKS